MKLTDEMAEPSPRPALHRTSGRDTMCAFGDGISSRTRFFMSLLGSYCKVLGKILIFQVPNFQILAPLFKKL